MIGPCTALAFTIFTEFDDREQVDGVGGVVPQQMIGPTPRLAERVHVGAAEEIGLHVHLLDVQLAGHDLLVHVLMARVKAAGVAAHRHQPARLLQIDDRLRVGQRIRQRDLDLDVLAGLHAGDALFGMHLGRRAQDDGVDILERQRVGEFGRDVLDAVFLGDLLGRLQPSPDQRHHLDAADVLDAVEMLDAERTRSRERDLDRFCHIRRSPE